ncbi:MAG: glutathione S-transferase family protein [Pseudomonadales bacterium]|nr:glutathione S-transferase family protein [Pseudomonadales bacterium]
MKLVIGNKNYSSWSLRPWLFLSVHGLPFEEVRIALDEETTAAQMALHTEAGKVPVLHDDGLMVWDSLAICEYVSEQYLHGKGWPADTRTRALARSYSAEMHSGFFEIRSKLPMNCRASGRKVALDPALQKDIARIDQIWSRLRAEHQDKGPWLFGEFSITDCMFAPVCSRFATYGIQVSALASTYAQYVLTHEKMLLWIAQGRAETETIKADEAG